MSEFDDLPVATDEKFTVSRRRKAPTKRERFFAQVIFALQQTRDAGLAPTVQSLRGFNSDLPVNQLKELMETERFAQACEELGIAISPTPGLEPQQVSALAIYLDTSVGATHAQRLRAAGVTSAQWKGWLRQPVFSQYLQNAASQSMFDAIPVAQQRIVEAAGAGERWAVELLMEMTGVHDRRGESLDVRSLLERVLTVLDEELDSGAFDRVAARLKAAAGQQVPVAIASTPVQED